MTIYTCERNVIKSRRKGWVAHVAHMENLRNTYVSILCWLTSKESVTLKTCVSIGL
jgi:hypothetical protein